MRNFIKVISNNYQIIVAAAAIAAICVLVACAIIGAGNSTNAQYLFGF